MPRGPDSATLFARQLVSLLTTQASSELAVAAHDPDGVALSAVSDASLVEFEQYLSLVLQLDRSRGRLTIRPDSVRVRLLAALRKRGRSDEEDGPATRIRSAIAAGRLDEATAEFAGNGGAFFSLVHGLDLAQRVVHAFPEAIRNADEPLALADAINAMKAGNVVHAKLLFEQRYGAWTRDLTSLCRGAARLSDDAICCRLVLAVSDEEAIGEDALALLFHRVEGMPADASMQRGMLYNVALDAFVRRGQWATAEETALRSRYHFANAQAHLSAFYIDLYLALIALARGDLSAAEARLADARGLLERFAAASPNDERLLATLDRICLYERGDPRPLSDFLLVHVQEEGFGEIWPSIAGPIIDYGARALAATTTLAATRAFIERWRLQQWRSDRFATTITLADIGALQFYGRWHAADEALADVIADGALRATDDELTEAEDRGLIAVGLRRCRSLLERRPADPALAATIAALLGNDRTTTRQRLTLLLWSAAAAVARGAWGAMHDAMAELAELVRATRLTAVLDEQRQPLARIFGDREARRRLSASAKLSAFMRDYNRQADPAVASVADTGFTRQEARILLLLAERVPNKTIARRLGLAVPTVRFHLRNVYRKLDCNHRKDAVAAAVRMGIVPE